MTVLFDTNVVLDLLLDREPFADAAVQVFSRVEAVEIKGYVCATTITTIHYLARKVIGTQKAKRAIRNLLLILEVAPVDRTVIERAIEGRYKDFEDGVVSESAQRVGAKAVITRNVMDFKFSAIPAYTPTELLKILQSDTA